MFTVKCAVTLRPSMALPSVASLALPRPKLPKAVLTPPRRLAASTPPKEWLVLYPPPCVGVQSTHAYVFVSCYTHATPTWRPPGPWPLLAAPYYCGTDVAEKGSAEGALAAGQLGGPALRMRACDAYGPAGFAQRHVPATRRVDLYRWGSLGTL